MRFGLQWSASPWAEASVGCQPDLPRRQHGTEQWHVVSEQAEVSVFVVAPRSAHVELEGAASADPPPERRRLEVSSDVHEAQRLPRAEFVRRHRNDRRAPMTSARVGDSRHGPREVLTPGAAPRTAAHVQPHSRAGSVCAMTSDDCRARVLELFDVVLNGRDVDAIRRFTMNPQIEGTLRSMLAAFSDL